MLLEENYTDVYLQCHCLVKRKMLYKLLHLKGELLILILQIVKTNEIEYAMQKFFKIVNLDVEFIVNSGIFICSNINTIISKIC